MDQLAIICRTYFSVMWIRIRSEPEHIARPFRIRITLPIRGQERVRPFDIKSMKFSHMYILNCYPRVLITHIFPKKAEQF
jgi:hypothetical protein